jgi:hypothetical protein
VPPPLIRKVQNSRDKTWLDRYGIVVFSIVAQGLTLERVARWALAGRTDG